MSELPDTADSRAAVARMVLPAIVGDYARSAAELAATADDSRCSGGRYLLRGQMGQARRDGDRLADALGVARPDWADLDRRALAAAEVGDGAA